MYNININNGLKEAMGSKEIRNCLLRDPQLFLEQVGVTFKYDLICPRFLE